MRKEEARRQLAERLERDYEKAPGRYRWRLGLLAGLGYAVLGFALVFTLLLAIALIAYCLVRPPGNWNIVIPILVLAMTGAVLLKAVWIRFDAPAGHLLAPDEAPALREEVERVRRALGAAPLKGIIIDAQLNAAAAQVPHGPGSLRQHHYLVLGLPLLHLLDRQELAAVIAHEFGHFQDRHGRFAAWIYGLRMRWYRVLAGLGDHGFASTLLFRWFFRWYAVYFDVRSFVLARRQEHAADEAAVAAVGAAPMARSLAKIGLAHDWLESEFWPDIQRSAQAQAYPPVQVHARLAQEIEAHAREWRRIPRWLLVHEPAVDDTHPGLAQRLSALGMEPADVRLDGDQSAARTLMDPPLLDRLEQRFSREWQADAKPAWEQRYRQAQDELRRLRALEDMPRRSPAEELEYAALVEDHRPGHDVAAHYREGLQSLPSHAMARYRLGAWLLRRGEDEEGLQHLQRAVSLSPDLGEPALRALHERIRRLPDDAALHDVATRLRVQWGQQGEAAGNTVMAEAVLPHGLDDTQVQALRRVLAGHDKVTAAWLASRPETGLSAATHYLVVVDWAGSVVSETAGIPRLAAQLTLPGPFTVLSTTGRDSPGRQLRQRAGEPVYRRR